MKLETVKITVPSGNKDTKVSTSYDLEQTYGNVVGLYIPESDSFNPDLEMEIRTLNGSTIHQNVKVRHYVASASVPHKERFMEMRITGGNKTIIFDVNRSENTASETSFFIVLQYDGQTV